MRKLPQSRGFLAALCIRAAFAFMAALYTVNMMAAAEDMRGHPQMLGEDLKAVFLETMMVGEYRSYRSKTQTYNYSEFHYEDGTTDYTEGDRVEKGVWTIVGNDKVCYRYPGSDYYNQTYCFFVFNVEGCYYKFSLTNMTLNGPRNWDRWSSRAVRKGSRASCAEPVS